MNHLEQVVQFSTHRRLIGVVSAPANINDYATKPAVLMLNAGLVHRVGPYRMHTTLARRLTELGFLVFRFDLSNIGDSQTIATEISYQEQIILDVKAAMDMLSQNYGVKRFVSIGLCSGAMNTHTASVADDRICGAILLDAYGYKTGKFVIKHIAPRLIKIFNPLKLFSFASKLRSNDASRGTEGIDYLDFPPKRTVEGDLRKLISRGTHMLFIYTGGVSFYYNYAEQLWDNFPFLQNSNLVELHYFYNVDHTFTLLKDRERLFEQILQWLNEHF